MRQIEIIGEASNSISAEFQEKYEQLPWSQMRAIRNKIVHDYRGINLQIIWETVQNDLPALEEQVREILGNKLFWARRQMNSVFLTLVTSAHIMHCIPIGTFSSETHDS